MRILLCLLLLQGCATIGDTEALNDAGMGDLREGVKVFNTTREVLGIPVERNRAPVINRGYGHARNMKPLPSSTQDIPYTVKGWIELERYLRSILE